MVLWFVSFVAGFVVVPDANIPLLVGESFLNGLAVLTITYLIIGRRRMASQALGVLLLLIISGYAYENRAALMASPADSTRNLYDQETTGLSQLLSPSAAGGFIGSIRSELGSASPPIDKAWVAQFMANVSASRRSQGYSPLVESQPLDQYAAQRFQIQTAGNNWQITHFGYENMPGGVGEVVLYPDGYSPSGFVSNVRTEAPLHWQLLTDPSLVQYGFYVGQGKTYGVYQPCPVTELPGPGINETQFFAQHGCQVSVDTVTWLVIDLGI